VFKFLSRNKHKIKYMRCAKCNRSLGLFVKFCPNCGTPIPPGQKKKSLINFLIWLGIFILLVPVIYYFASHGASAKNYTVSQNFGGAVAIAFLGACVLFLVYYLIYRLVKFTIRRPVWGSIIIVVFVLQPAISGYVVFQYEHQKAQFQTATADIQQELSEAANAKLTGDLLKAKKPANGVTLDTVQTKAITAAKNLAALSVPDHLKNYQAAAILWSLQVATTQTSDWKNLQNQPNDFSLVLSDTEANDALSLSLKNIENFKKDGVDAITKKDRGAMGQIAAKLLVQQHWLSALLHSSQTGSTAFNIAPAALAALQPVPDVKGMDVTCSACDYPDFYKIHWTDKLRKQYGCDTTCHPKTTVNTGTTPQQTQNSQNQTQGQGQAAQDTAAQSDAAKYADYLNTYSYKDVPNRKVCIGRGGTASSAGGNVYCVEDAVTSTNEITASAIGFAESTKALSVNQWNNEYQDIDLAILPAGTTGQAPSTPSANGGHQEGGMGTISNGEPSTPPKPAAPPAQKGGYWDGEYHGEGTFACTGSEPLTGQEIAVSVKNNGAFSYGWISEVGEARAPIGPDGHAELLNQKWIDTTINTTFQFTMNQGGKASVKIVQTSDLLDLRGEIFHCTESGEAVRQ
jgi:flagellar basal body-associated protein FliL